MIKTYDNGAIVVKGGAIVEKYEKPQMFVDFFEEDVILTSSDSPIICGAADDMVPIYPIDSEGGWTE